MLHKIDSDTPFDVVFLYFGEPGDIPYQGGYRNILTCLDFMSAVGIGASIILKSITSDQIAQWAFGKCFVPFRLPKMIVVDADGLFPGMSRNPFQ